MEGFFALVVVTLFVISLITLIRPLPRLNINTRKRAGSLLFLSCVLFVVFGAVYGEKKETATLEETPVSSEHTMPTGTPEQAFQQMMKEQVGERFKSLKLDRLIVDGVGTYIEAEADRPYALTVEFRVNDSFTHHLTKRSIERDMMNCFSAAFHSNLPVGRVTMEAYTPLTDRFGQTKEGLVYRASLEKPTAQKINWQRRHELDFAQVASIHFRNVAFAE